MNLETEKKVKFITLGCRVNQYETQGMREAMSRAGAVSFLAKNDKADSVDYVVINTCTVTEEADKENRYWIRRAKRDYPNARIVVTGCGVERDRAKIEALPEVDFVLANHEKAEIANRLIEGCASPVVQSGVNPKHLFTPLSISEAEGHARAFIKIQDGCNHACSFCKVVMVRGRSRSRDLRDVIDEVIRLRDTGFKEVVFAGIQLGAYGLDISPGGKIAEVIRETAKIDGIERIRLSSIEPTDVTPKLIETIAGTPKCGHHLHIPLQSGDDDILKGMNRRYGRSFYIDLIARLKAAMPDFQLTLDVMAGFPGEEAVHFQNTVDLIREVKPLSCHVFPYSRREGTRAAVFTNVPPALVKERVQALNDLSAEMSLKARESYLGKKMFVLTENYKRRSEAGQFQGLTENFMKVYFEGKPEWFRSIIPVELLSFREDGFSGRVIGGDKYGMAV